MTDRPANTFQSQAVRCTPPLCSIALLSAATLAYEILLMRLFSIIQWHHFAYMIISLALLGYGISGTFLAFTRRWLLERFPAAFLINTLLFGIVAMASYLLAQNIAFNPEEVLWDPGQSLRLLAVYLLLSLPFFFAANSIGLALMMVHPVRLSRVYAVDLIGAGAGSLGVVILLYAVFPVQALALLGTLGITAAALAAWEMRWRGRAWFTLVAIGIAGLVQVLDWPAPVMSPYKPLQQVLRISGSRVVVERSSPLGLVSVVENLGVPLRHAPGMSVLATTIPPEQLGLFTDGSAMSVITNGSDLPRNAAHLDQQTSALPYHLDSAGRVLIIGAGGGEGILQARYHTVPNIDAIELNPQIVALVRTDFAAYAGEIYSTAGITIHTGEARGFLAGTNQHYDVIQLSMPGSSGATSTGLHALSESYLFTTGALLEYLEHLSPGGYLVITHWVRVPPRDTLKLVATAADALAAAGFADAGRHLMLIRGWQTATLLIKNDAITPGEISRLRHFSTARAFDLVYYPGMSTGEANRFNVLRTPAFHHGVEALLGKEREDYIDRYKFNLEPATDDRPYFFQFFRWRALPEILSLRGRGGIPLLEWGYLVLTATLAQAVLASIALILLPLIFLRRRQTRKQGSVTRVRVLVFFFMVGLAFMFIEIASIQKFILFLNHPLYAVAVVLTAFLVVAGIGSAWTRRFVSRLHGRFGIRAAVGGIVIVGLLYLFALGPLFSFWMSLPVAIKVLISLALIAPLAFFMGMPFPLALAGVSQSDPDLVPWAWGINGCASVIGAVLATLLAVHAGFNSVILAALALYTVAALSASAMEPAQLR